MLATVDLTLSLDEETYRRDVPRLQVQLRRLAFDLYRRQGSMIVVYEGWDASGKGGNIRRVTEKLDPRGYEVHSIAAPRGEDRTHHYLWRFWRRLRPADDKQIILFDRSWYGRVMVERAEGFATAPEWRRAFREINDFERQLVDANVMVVKFFLHLSKEEQARRFEARSRTAHKRWKLTEEDWRNREKWDVYEEAIEDMLTRTSTIQAPWTVVAGEDKRWARRATLQVLVDRLRSHLETLPAPDSDPRVSETGPDKKNRKRKKGKSRS